MDIPFTLFEVYSHKSDKITNNKDIFSLEIMTFYLAPLRSYLRFGASGTGAVRRRHHWRPVGITKKISEAGKNRLGSKG